MGTLIQIEGAPFVFFYGFCEELLLKIWILFTNSLTLQPEQLQNIK